MGEAADHYFDFQFAYYELFCYIKLTFTANKNSF